MGTHKPALLDVVKVAGWVSLSLFRSALRPKRWGKRLSMLVDGECVVGMRIVDPQIRFQESEI